MTTKELAEYYAKLLIIQYFKLAKATKTIEAVTTPFLLPQISRQVISFSSQPSSGSFVLAYDEASFPAIAWDDTSAQIQEKLRSIEGFEHVAVAGSIASQSLTILLNGILLPASKLTVATNSMESSTSEPVTVGVSEVDVTLPIAIRDAFNLVGDDLASGVHLDLLGKYIGVRRQVMTRNRNINLSDQDFITLMRMSIIKNNSDSSLYAIDSLLHQFFPGDITVQDFRDMNLLYTISPNVASPDLVEMFLEQDILPRPLGVGTGIITFELLPFGFSELTLPAPSDVDGFGEGVSVSYDLELDDGSTLELDDGSTLVVVPDVNDFEPLTEGGLFAELIEV